MLKECFWNKILIIRSLINWHAFGTGRMNHWKSRMKETEDNWGYLIEKQGSYPCIKNNNSVTSK